MHPFYALLRFFARHSVFREAPILTNISTTSQLVCTCLVAVIDFTQSVSLLFLVIKTRFAEDSDCSISVIKRPPTRKSAIGCDGAEKLFKNDFLHKFRKFRV